LTTEHEQRLVGLFERFEDLERPEQTLVLRPERVPERAGAR